MGRTVLSFCRQNGSVVLPAERFCRSAGRTVLSFCRQNGSVVLPAERFCRSAGRTVLPFCRQNWWALKCTVYIYRWLKKGMERISDGQNGSAVLPAELMGPKVHCIYLDRHKWGSWNFQKAELFCHFLGRTDGPQSALYIYKIDISGDSKIFEWQNGSEAEMMGPKSSPFSYTYKWE